MELDQQNQSKMSFNDIHYKLSYNEIIFSLFGNINYTLNNKLV